MLSVKFCYPSDSLLSLKFCYQSNSVIRFYHITQNVYLLDCLLLLIIFFYIHRIICYPSDYHSDSLVSFRLFVITRDSDCVIPLADCYPSSCMLSTGLFINCIICRCFLMLWLAMQRKKMPKWKLWSSLRKKDM